MPAKDGSHRAKLVAALGQVARNGRSGRLMLRPPAGAKGVCLTFGRGALTGVTPTPSGGGWGPAQVERAALRKTIEKVALEATSLGAEPEFLAEPDATPGAAPSIDGLNAADIAIDISRRIDDVSWLKRDLPSLLTEKLCPPASPPEIQPRQALGPGEAFLLSRADGTLTLQQILDTAPFSEEETLRALFALRAVGMLTAARQVGSKSSASVRPAGRLKDLDRFLAKTSAVQAPPAALPTGAARSVAQTAPPGPPRGEPDAAPRSPGQVKERDAVREWCRSVGQGDYYVRLGVNRGAAEPAIRRAYYRLARQYHPDRLRKPHLEDMGRELEGAFATITEAYNTLTNPDARSEYDRELAERTSGRKKDMTEKAALAREAFLRARKQIEEQQVYEAIRLLESAVEHDPTRAEYFHHLGACLAHNPRWRKRAEENLLKAIQMNPSSAQSYIELARVYSKGGLERRAHEMYEQVLAWDPDNKEALTQLGRQKGPEGAGLLRHLFKKD